LLPGHEDKVFTMAQPFTFGEVAIMLWLTILGIKEKHLAAAKS
jgi:hypothetical protein